jgi:hypothetical protein
MDEVIVCPLGSAVHLTARPRQRLFRLILEFARKRKLFENGSNARRAANANMYK